MSGVLTKEAPATFRCPACGSIDWFRDGCVIAAVDERIELRCGRVQHADPRLAGTSWSCNQCAHEEPAGSQLARALDGIRHETCDHPEGG
jgi:predicted RNA-binding Zn-ribbon protein involved in translation (DUF1610 family)